MKRIIISLVGLCLVMGLAAYARSKFDDQFNDTTEALNSFLSETHGIPPAVLERARCILVCPKPKHTAFAVGPGSKGCTLVCRGEHGSMTGKGWGPPVMYTMSGSAGHLADYVFLMMTERSTDEILKGRLTLGADLTVAAGPSSNASFESSERNADILVYSGNEGSLGTSEFLGKNTIKVDAAANDELYGKPADAKQIVSRNVSTPVAAEPLVDLLNRKAPRAR